MMNNNPIDIVLPWVDEKDTIWEAERKKWASKSGQGSFESSNVRFQCWDNLNLWFRAIEECMPWINKIFLITFGHIPSFLNTEHVKLRIVRHEEYIPFQYD